MKKLYIYLLSTVWVFCVVCTEHRSAPSLAENEKNKIPGVVAAHMCLDLASQGKRPGRFGPQNPPFLDKAASDRLHRNKDSVPSTAQPSERASLSRDKNPHAGSICNLHPQK